MYRDDDYNLCSCVGEIEEIYYNTIKKLLGEDKAETISDLVEMEKKRAELRYLIEEENKYITSFKEDIEDYKEWIVEGNASNDFRYVEDATRWLKEAEEHLEYHRKELEKYTIELNAIM